MHASLKRLCIALLLAGCVEPMYAQDAAAQLCMDAFRQSNAAYKNCLGAEVIKAEAALDSLTQQVLRRVEEDRAWTAENLDTDIRGLEWHDERLGLFRTTQETWLAHREATCAAVSHAAMPGSAASANAALCRLEATHRRIAELKERYLGG